MLSRFALATSGPMPELSELSELSEPLPSPLSAVVWQACIMVSTPRSLLSSSCAPASNSSIGVSPTAFNASCTALPVALFSAAATSVFGFPASFAAFLAALFADITCDATGTAVPIMRLASAVPTPSPSNLANAAPTAPPSFVVRAFVPATRRTHSFHASRTMPCCSSAVCGVPTRNSTRS